jgi:hypothetical protein
MNRFNFSMFPWYLWLTPFAVFVAGAPFWLHVWEPGMFLSLNQWACRYPRRWTGLSLLGNGCLACADVPVVAFAPRLMWAWLCAAPFALLAREAKSLKACAPQH